MSVCVEVDKRINVPLWEKTLWLAIAHAMGGGMVVDIVGVGAAVSEKVSVVANDKQTFEQIKIKFFMYRKLALESSKKGVWSKEGLNDFLIGYALGAGKAEEYNHGRKH